MRNLCDVLISTLRRTRLIMLRMSVCGLTASMMHSNSSDAPTRLVVFRGHRTSEDAPDAVPSGQYDPTGHLF